MKTTLMIDDGVMQRLKEEAARRQTTISALVEDALRSVLDTRDGGESVLPSLPVHDLGAARVDIADREALYQAMEGR